MPLLIEKHGGKYRGRDGDSQVLEGNWSPSRLIILEFPDREAALALSMIRAELYTNIGAFLWQTES